MAIGYLNSYLHLSSSPEVKSVSFTAWLWLNWQTDCLFLYWRLTVCSIDSHTKNTHSRTSISYLTNLLLSSPFHFFPFRCKCLFPSLSFFISKSLFLLFLLYCKTRRASRVLDHTLTVVQILDLLAQTFISSVNRRQPLFAIVIFLRHDDISSMIWCGSLLRRKHSLFPAHALQLNSIITTYYLFISCMGVLAYMCAQY